MRKFDPYGEASHPHDRPSCLREHQKLQYCCDIANKKSTMLQIGLVLGFEWLGIDSNFNKGCVHSISAHHNIITTLPWNIE
jgi:hypothetical protein